MLLLKQQVSKSIDSTQGYIVNTHSKNCAGPPFQGDWDYSDSGWKKDKTLTVTEIVTTRK